MATCLNSRVHLTQPFGRASLSEKFGIMVLSPKAPGFALCFRPSRIFSAEGGCEGAMGQEVSPASHLGSSTGWTDPAEVDTANPVIAALLEKRGALAADLAVAEDTVSQLRRQITALSETLRTFGHLEPERDRMPAAVRHKRSKEGFRKGELTRRVLEKIRDAAEPVRPVDVARAIMVECLMDQGDQKLAIAFQHKVHNLIRRQWQRGIVERVGTEDGWNARWRVAGW